jgi:hypothetical protein
VRNLIALDAANVIARMEARKDELIPLFSKLRDREPLLGTLRSWFPSATFRDLSVLDAPQQTAVSTFYEQLDQLRWYFHYTVDMPSAAQHVFVQHHRRLVRAYTMLLSSLGPPVTEAEAIPLAPGRRRSSAAGRERASARKKPRSVER